MSILIFSAFYNRAEQVAPSVSSLLNSAPIDATIVLVNDGSTDSRTLKELMKFSSDSRVEIVNQENKGFAKTLSTVLPSYIEVVKPNYVAIHGAGDLCEADKFTKQLSYLERNKDVIALGCGHRVVSITTGSTISEVKGLTIASEESLFVECPFTHGTVIYRISAFLKAGGYNELFKYCQDWELYFRLLPYGKIVRYPEVLYTKYIFNDGASFKPQKKVEQMKYNMVARSRQISYEFFQESIEKLKSKGIDEAVSNFDFTKKYKRVQLSLIAKGEFELAREWIEIIDSENKIMGQKFLNIILRFFILLKFPAKLFPLLTRAISKFRKPVINNDKF